MRNPNEIVPSIVNEAALALGDSLQCVMMHGDAVSHEFSPDRSVISLLFILKRCDSAELDKVAAVFLPWLKKANFEPRFMSEKMLEDCATHFPVEILGIQHSYRVLHGEDLIAQCNICKDRLLEQCRRELAGILLLTSGGFVSGSLDSRKGERKLSDILASLIPVFTALLVVYDKKIPHATSEIIAAIEDLYGFGPSLLSEIFLGRLRMVNTTAYKTFYDIIKRIYEETDFVRIDHQNCDSGGEEELIQ